MVHTRRIPSRASAGHPVTRLAIAACVTASVITGLLIVEPRLRAQSTSPGGVTGSSLWVKADQGLQVNGSNQVQQWLDQSGSGNTTIQLQASIDDTAHAITPTNDILRVPVVINFNPAVVFDGAADRSLKGAAATSFGGGGISVYAVSIVDGPSNGSLTAVFDTLNDWNAGGAVGVGLGITTTAYALDGSGCMTAFTTSPTNVPRVARGVYVATTNGSGGSTWLDGVKEATGGNCPSTAGPLFEVGGRTGGPQTLDSRIFKGKVAEVIVYKSVLSAANTNKVESYLALKYGITLRQSPAAQSYTDSTGAVFWDSTLNATYKNNIAGIGRDDGSALAQRQSQSVNTASSGNLITMGLGTIATDNASNANTFAADRNFLVWGDDGASPAFATSITTPGSVPTVGPVMRMTRTWRMQETGTVPSVKVGVPTTTAPGSLLYMVVSNDTTFDSTDQWIAMSSFSSGSSSYTAADFDFTNGQYFTFASVPLTDLVITKTDNQTLYVPGKPISYSLVVSNVGASNATGVSVLDTVPAVITGVTVSCAATGTATCGTNGSSGNTVSFTGASLTAGAGNQLTITVSGTVSTATTGNLVNTATVAAGTGQNDPNTANNTATDTDTPAQADLSITKTGPASATPGANVVYALTVTNNGPNLAAAVTVTDPTPAGLTLVSNSGACTSAFPCALGDLTSGATRTITTTYSLPSTYTTPNPITNTATATTVTADPNSPNNTVSVMTPVSTQSDVQIVKSVSSAPVLPGQNYTYTLQVTNNGPSVATGVVATDTLPVPATFVSSVAGCTAVGQAITCPTIATMIVNASQSFDIVVQLSPAYTGDGSDILNSATVTSTSNDPALQNNTTPAGAPPVGPPGADVTIVKSVNATPVAPGETFTYSLLVSNQGPSTASNVIATDNLPTHLTFVSSPEGCTAAGQAVTCPTIASLSAGASMTFNLLVQLDPAYTGNGSDLGNTATVQSPTADPVPGNNTTGPVPPTLGPPSADLSISKATIETTVMPGQNFTYRLTVTNAGPSVAQSVTATDTLPTGLHFMSSPQGCTAAGQVVTCTQALLGAAATATFDVIVQLDASYTGNGSDLGNVASTSASTSDPNTANNTTAIVPPPTIVLGSADLTIDKTGPVGAVPGGGTITYTLTVSNQGPNLASNVVVQDPTPSNLTFISTSGDCTTPFPCALGVIQPGLSKTITATYSVAMGATALSNTATVSSPSPDPATANNSATAQTPSPAKSYYFSEGATGGFFDYDLMIANPNTTDAPVTLNFFTQDGTTITRTATVAARSRLTVRVDDIPGLEATTMSVQVVSESGLSLAVERSMFWDSTYYAGHTGTAVTAPATKWYFAEGFQGYFNTYVLLENPGATPADVTVTFLREYETPFVKLVNVAPFTRVTVDASDDSGSLFQRGFGIVIDATQPVVAERSMYFNTTAAHLWGGGHSSAGVTDPAWQWFLPEGATGGFFDEWILLSNPQTTDAHVTLDYQLQDGTVVSLPKVVPAQRRLTVSVDQEPDARLQNASVSTRVTSDVPIVAERSMYWGSKPDANPWSEGHNSFGMTESALRWSVAEGRVGGPLNYHTYLLLSNPQAAPAEVTVTFLRENSLAPVVKTYTVPATTRFNIDVNAMVPELQSESFGAFVEVTNGVTIAVERSMYWDANGIFWSGGTNSPGTKVP